VDAIRVLSGTEIISAATTPLSVENMVIAVNITISEKKILRFKFPT